MTKRMKGWVYKMRGLKQIIEELDDEGREALEKARARRAEVRHVYELAEEAQKAKRENKNPFKESSSKDKTLTA